MTDEAAQASATSEPFLGAGCATALSGAIAARLVASVATLTLAHDTYAPVWPEADAIKREADETADRLRRAAADDASAFEAIIVARRRRDAAGSARARAWWAREAVRRMRPAIVVPLETATMTLRVADLALALFDRGLQSAAGDAAAATMLALSATGASLYLVHQNLALCGGLFEDLRAKAATLEATRAGRRADAVRRFALDRFSH